MSAKEAKPDTTAGAPVAVGRDPVIVERQVITHQGAHIQVTELVLSPRARRALRTGLLRLTRSNKSVL